MKVGKLSALLLTVLIASTLALAQGSGSSGGATSASRSYSVTRTLDAKILSIDTERNLVSIELDNGERYQLAVHEKTKYKADKKTSLRGKKDLSLSDFEPGQTVKVKYRADSGQVTEVRLKKDKVEEGAEADT
jgi:hypothetical protein